MYKLKQILSQNIIYNFVILPAFFFHKFFELSLNLIIYFNN